MKLKKIVPIALSLAIALTMSACSKKEESVESKSKTNQTVEISEDDKSYVKKFNEIYKDKIESLSDFEMYLSLNKTMEYFNSNEYPGNKEYLKNIKDMYVKSKENITEFTKELENITNIDNVDLQKMKTSLLSEAKLAVANIDKKIERINQIPESILESSKDDFLKLVDETAKIKDGVESTFSSMVKYSSEKFNSK